MESVLSLNIGRLCDYADKQKTAEVAQCQPSGLSFKRPAASTSYLLEFLVLGHFLW